MPILEMALIFGWTEGQNHAKFAVTLDEMDSYLTIVTAGTGTNQRAFLNLVEIVLVPEPSTWWLTGAGMAEIVLLRRRRAVRRVAQDSSATSPSGSMNPPAFAIERP